MDLLGIEDRTQRGVLEMRSRNSFFSLVMMLVMLLSSIAIVGNALTTQAQSQDNEEPFVILFDQSHGQYFNSTLYKTALQAVTEMFQLHSDKLPPLEIHYNDARNFSRELLAGVDLLIITNPGSSASGTFTEKEKLALVEWYQSGKGMILLSNPYVQNDDNVTGNPQALNSLLDNNYITISGALFTVTEHDGKKYPDILIDEKHSLDQDNQFLEIDLAARPKDETAVDELLYNVTTVYTWTQSISAQNKTIKAWPTTVKKLPSGNVEVPSGIPLLYGASVVAETGFRVILGGSSFMFSDWKVNVTDARTWIESGDNLQLWLNSILWAGHFVPEDVLTPSQDVLELPDVAIVGSLALVGLALVVIGVGYRFVGPFPLEIIGVDEAARRLKNQKSFRRKVASDSASTVDKAAATPAETKGAKSAPTGKRSRRRRQLGKKPSPPTTKKRKK